MKKLLLINFILMCLAFNFNTVNAAQINPENEYCPADIPEAVIKNLVANYPKPTMNQPFAYKKQIYTYITHNEGADSYFKDFWKKYETRPLLLHSIVLNGDMVEACIYYVAPQKNMRIKFKIDSVGK